jgi:thiol-disulfide isomerase/thioredoxin
MKLTNFLIFALIFVTACTVNTSKDLPINSNPDDSPLNPGWMETELKDVNSGEYYRISDFEGKKVLIESFAVWCPLCTKQQVISKELHEELPEVVSINIDTDPNEDEATVKNHAESNGFDWRYSVAPVDFTRSLIDQFGNNVVNAPSVPMILVCEDQSTRLLGRGVKSVDDLKEELNKGCAV